MTRLIASDLDGTLFGPDHVPEPRTVAALNAAREAGIVTAAVTGRSHFGGTTLVVSTGAELDWFIGSNGGHRVNMASGRLEERLLFEPALLEEMSDVLPRALGDVGFGLEHEAGFSFDEAFLAVHPLSIEGVRRRSSAERILTDVGKWFVTHPDFEPREMVDRLRPYLPSELHVTTSGIAFVEITPAGADKGSALARLCAQLEIDAHDVVAFGDNHNDLTMIEWAGRGIAMGNAAEEVQAIADEITATNVEFGVAQVIERLL